MRCRLFLIVLGGLLFYSSNLRSQDGYELGGWLGISNYFGDMNTNYRITDPGLAGGISFRNLFNDRLAYRASLSYGSVRADDKDSSNPFERDRNLNFKSIIIDLTNQIDFNFLPFQYGSRTDYFTPYLSVGFNLFYYDPVTSLDGKKYHLREYGTEGQQLGDEYFQFSTGFVTGFGFKWAIDHALSLNVEASFRFTGTDYLDDVSTTYPNTGELRSLRGEEGVMLSDRSGIPGFAAQGKQRGNSRDKDRFSFIGVSMMYYFGQVDCPKINKYGF